MPDQKYDIIIIGGGLAGLVNSILLSRNGFNILLIEAKKYPFHRVCGEYISNEVIPFLEKHDLFPYELEPSKIDSLQISSVSGNTFHSPLDLGGFGISRYALDQWLVGHSRASGSTILEGTKAMNVSYKEGNFTVTDDQNETYKSKIVIATHGKRAKLDKTLDRDFIKHRSPYVGVKYHVHADFPDDLIALHNFEGGYCGVSKIEGDRYNMCYLTHRDQVKKHGSIPEMEKHVVFKNPHLKKLFSESEFLFEKPEVINEITFAKKEPVYQHMLISGDAAGMITPLCGNGMAMAIHSAKILSEIIIENHRDHTFDLPKIERQYTKAWNKEFATRLWAGRKIQNLFGGQAASEIAVNIGKYIKPIRNALISQTHGSPFS